MTPEFLNFVLESPPALDLLKWLNRTLVPDEHYWATLMYNQHVGAPKSYLGTCWSWPRRPYYMKNWISRYQLWSETECKGKILRMSCIFGVRDLPVVIGKHHLFTHKVLRNFEPATMHCLKEWHMEKQAAQLLLSRNATEFYTNLPIVKYYAAGNGSEC